MASLGFFCCLLGFFRVDPKLLLFGGLSTEKPKKVGERFAAGILIFFFFFLTG